MSSKKRKASELQHEPKLNGKQARNPSVPHRQTPPTNPPNTNDSSNSVVPFRIQCPAKAGSEKIDKARDLFRARDSPDLPELAIEYTIRPGSKWSSIRNYRNVKFMDQTFTTGQIVYVNRKFPAPVPPEDASDAELLKFDKTNLWVGKIAQTKAESDKAVFLRVFWLYWPEELPMGRQPYHGERELVMSNAMDIIDAQTITSAAEVSHWDENDDESDGNQKERFWRQTFDVNKLGPKQDGGLNALRTHCVCDRAYNPDHTMYKCFRDDCGIWNHEECLEDALLQDSWKKLQRGGLEEDADHRESASQTSQTAAADHMQALGDKVIHPVEVLGQIVKKRIMQSIDQGFEAVKHESTIELQKPNHSTNTKKTGAKKANGHSTEKRPWDGRLEAIIRISDIERGVGTVSGTLKLLDGKKVKGKTEPKQWTFKLDCLKCGKPLD